MGRNDQTDAGRKGGTQTKASTGYQMPVQPNQGEWKTAYSGKMGTTAQQDEPEFGNQGEETGVDFDRG